MLLLDFLVHLRLPVIDADYCAPFFPVTGFLVAVKLEGVSEGGESKQAEPFAHVMWVLVSGTDSALQNG